MEDLSGAIRGINDVLRNQEFSSGLRPSDYTFGEF